MNATILALPGDGIGREVMSPCLALVDIAVARAGGFRLTFDQHDAGADLYRSTGVAMPDTTLRAAESADAILLGAMGLPSVSANTAMAGTFAVLPWSVAIPNVV